MLYKINLIKTTTKPAYLTVRANDEEEAFRMANSLLDKPHNKISYSEGDTETITLEFDDLEAEVINETHSP